MSDSPPPSSSSSVDSSSTASPQDELEGVLDTFFDDEDRTRMRERLTFVFESGPFKEHSGSSFHQDFEDFVRRIFRDAKERERIARHRRRREQNVTALHVAARLGIPRLCEALVLKFEYDVHALGFHTKSTALHLATHKNHISTVEMLIHLGANIDCIDGLQRTPLHIAVARGYEELVRLLISRGANTEATCFFGTPLQYAAAASQQSTLKILLENNVNVNAFPSNCRLTPLHMAVKQGSIECLKLLLAAGAQPNTISFGTTPLCDAASRGTTEMVHLLLISGANPNALDAYGSTPLEIAIRAFRDESASMLLPLTCIFAEFNLTQIRGCLNSIENTPQRWNKKVQVFRRATAEGNQELSGENYFNAVHCYTAAIYANPSDATLYLCRSFAYARLFEGQNALNDAQQCVRLKPDWAKAYLRKAAAWELLKDNHKALEALYTARRLQPGNVYIERRIRYLRAEMAWS